MEINEATMMMGVTDTNRLNPVMHKTLSNAEGPLIELHKCAWAKALPGFFPLKFRTNCSHCAKLGKPSRQDQ
jgi:hypothetical protein